MKNKSFKKLTEGYIENKNKFFTGELVEEVYLFGNRWVANVCIQQDKLVLYKIPIADYNLNIRSFRKGTPVLLEKKGMSFWIVGKSDYKKETITKTKYILPTQIQKIKGISFSDEKYFSSLGNQITVPNTQTQTYSIEVYVWPYGDLTPYGTYPYGKSEIQYKIE